MARFPRLYLEGCAQYVIRRGNNREACFCDDAAIKEATNKSWVLGSDRFKVKIEEKTGRCAVPSKRGDRK